MEVYIVNLMAMPLTYRELRNAANFAAVKDTSGMPEEKFCSVVEEQMTFLHNPWVRKLSPPEQEILKKVAPYLQEPAGHVHNQHQHYTHTSSVHSTPSKSVSEILLQTRVRETDLLQVLGKLPFIQIVRKVVPPYVST
ncbi:hypothetical protein EON65_26570 [archaeon]|nr:MAG: hypothetical protein EON65_26570 [archaeon]